MEGTQLELTGSSQHERFRKHFCTRVMEDEGIKAAMESNGLLAKEIGVSPEENECVGATPEIEHVRCCKHPDGKCDVLHIRNNCPTPDSSHPCEGGGKGQ